MKQDDKELLLKDICARLPYGVKARVYNHWSDDIQDETITIENLHQLIKTFSIEDIKPYLFPISSISEEQKKYISDRWGVNEDFDFEIDPNWGEYFVDLCDSVDFINWCYENHFDINGLIPKGSALDATDKNIY